MQYLNPQNIPISQKIANIFIQSAMT